MKTIQMTLSREQAQKTLEMSRSRGNIELLLGNRSTSGSYLPLTNKPSINGEILIHDKSFEDLGEYNMTNFEILEMFNRIFGGN